MFKYLVLFILVGGSVTLYSADASEADLFRVQGLKAFQEGKNSEAESLLRQALDRDSSAQGAREALDSIEKAKKDATGYRDRAKSLSSDVGSSADDKGGAVGTTGLSTESFSEPYRSEKGRNSSLSSNEWNPSAFDGRLLERPSEFRNTSLFTRYGLDPQQFRPTLEPVSFLPKDEFLEQARDWPDQAVWNSMFQYRLAYDTNFSDVVDDATVPATMQNQGAVTHHLNSHVQVRSTPLRRFWYGADLNGGIKYFARSDFQKFNLVPLGGGLVGSWWNARNMDFTIRYDAATSWLGRSEFGFHGSSHGPSASLAALAGRSFQVNLGYAFRRNFFRTRPGTADLTGWRASTHVADLQLTSTNLASKFHPYFRTVFQWNTPVSRELRSQKKTFGLGTTALLSGFKLKGGVDFSYFTFPRGILGRIEHRWSLYAAGDLRFTQRLSASLSLLRDIQKSTIGDLYTFNRTAGALGVLYQL